MNSSTSSSNPRFTWKSMLVLTLFLMLSMELVARVVFDRKSGDFQRFRTYPASSQALANARAYRVAMIGSSTTVDCTLANVVQADLEQRLKRPVEVDEFGEGGSTITTWYYIMNHYFWEPNRRPDMFVITFFGGNNHFDLADHQDLDIAGLAKYLTTSKDWPDLFRTDLTDQTEQGEFIGSHYSSAYADRVRIKQKLMQLCIPDYQHFTSALNANNLHHAEAVSGIKPGANTYDVLARFLAKAQANDSKLCFIAYPTAQCQHQAYSVDPKAIAMIQAAGAQYVDLRNFPKSYNVSYRDGIHLAKGSTPIYSLQVGEAIAPVCSKYISEDSKPLIANQQTSNTKPSSNSELAMADLPRTSSSVAH